MLAVRDAYSAEFGRNLRDDLKRKIFPTASYGKLVRHMTMSRAEWALKSLRQARAAPLPRAPTPAPTPAPTLSPSHLTRGSAGSSGPAARQEVGRGGAAGGGAPGDRGAVRAGREGFQGARRALQARQGWRAVPPRGGGQPLAQLRAGREEGARAPQRDGQEPAGDWRDADDLADRCQAAGRGARRAAGQGRSGDGEPRPRAHAPCTCTMHHAPCTYTHSPQRLHTPPPSHPAALSALADGIGGPLPPAVRQPYPRAPRARTRPVLHTMPSFTPCRPSHHAVLHTREHLELVRAGFEASLPRHVFLHTAASFTP